VKRMHMISPEEKGDVIEQMYEMGVGEYLTTRIDEAARLARSRLTEGRRSGEGMAYGLKLLQLLRDMDYDKRTPQDGLSASDIADAIEDGKKNGIYFHPGHRKPKDRDCP